MAPDDGSGGLTKSLVVEWVKGIPLGKKGWTVGTLIGSGGALVAFTKDPIGFLRSELAPMVVGGVLDAFAPIIEGALFLLVGSEVGYPGYPPAEGVTYGLTDALPLVVDIFLSPVLTLIRTGVGGLISINQLLIPEGTPFAAIIVYALLVGETLVIAEVARRGVRALLDSIPVGSGIETFIFGGES